MKLSYNQFRELYGNRSVTDWAKFNWLGEYPVVNNFNDTITSVKQYTVDLKAGKKYRIELVNNCIKTEGTYPYEYVRFYSTGFSIGDVHIAEAGESIIVQVDSDINTLYIYPNVNNAYSVGYVSDIHFIISDYVENLVADATTLGSYVMVKKADNNYHIKGSNSIGHNEGLQRIHNSSNFELGTYRVHYDANRNVNYVNPSKTLKFGLYNITKTAYIVEATNNTDFTFTLTEDNYSVGDNLGFYFQTYDAAAFDIDFDITNFYVAKMSYGIVDLGTLSWNIDTNIFYLVLSDKANGSDLYCPIYETSANTAWSTPNKHISGYASNKNLYVRDDDYADATAFKNHLSGIELLYKVN